MISHGVTTNFKVLEIFLENQGTAQSWLKCIHLGLVIAVSLSNMVGDVWNSVKWDGRNFFFIIEYLCARHGVKILKKIQLENVSV